jgi:hypothetical protein
MQNRESEIEKKVFRSEKVESKWQESGFRCEEKQS